jgi:hypothetical protein
MAEREFNKFTNLSELLAAADIPWIGFFVCTLDGVTLWK